MCLVLGDAGCRLQTASLGVRGALCGEKRTGTGGGIANAGATPTPRCIRFADIAAGDDGECALRFNVLSAMLTQTLAGRPGAPTLASEIQLAARCRPEMERGSDGARSCLVRSRAAGLAEVSEECVLSMRSLSSYIDLEQDQQ